MDTSAQMDTTTEAVIVSATTEQGSSVTALDRIVNTVGFSYSSDMLQVGDPFSLEIPNPRGQYDSGFIAGSQVKLFLRNPNVNGGQLTLKHLGIIKRRRTSASPHEGRMIRIECQDLGCHLQENSAPLWYRTQGKRFIDLLEDPKWIDPSWGIRGIRTDNETNRLLRQGLNQGRAQANLDNQNILGTFTYLQVEPGDKVLDHIITYARRINRLVNVSCDGFLQIWNPDYEQVPNFRIELHDLSDPDRNHNNVLDVSIEESIDPLFTNTTCIGEIVGGQLVTDSTNQNAGKRRGDFVYEKLLPFARRQTFCDGEVYDPETARKVAQWKFLRGIFDSWQAVYVVRGHWQRPWPGGRAYWWESDQMCSVNDSLNGLSGNFYIQSVRLDRDARSGDRTTITLRRPGLLSAAYGIYKKPPRIKGSVQVAPKAITKTETKTEVTQ